MPDFLITFIASILIWLMYAGLVVMWVIDGRIKREQALHALFSSIIAWIIAQMIKTILDTPRPFMVNGEPPMTLTSHTDPAFPSAHTALAFSLATSVWLHDKKVGATFVVLALLVGFGRVLANVHYPIDIIGGGLVGIVIAIAFDRLHLFEILKRLKG